MASPSDELLLELQMAEYAMKFVPWKKQMSADGKTIFLNSRTNELTDLPDPEFMELQDRLDAARNAVKEAEENQTKKAKDAFEEWLKNHNEIQSTSRFALCQQLCESFDFWKLIPHEERIEIFYKFTNSSAQHEVEKMNTDMKLLEDKVEYLQFQAEYHQDQTKKISDLVYQKEIKQKMEIDGLNKQLKGQNLHDLENHNKDFGAQESDLKEQYLRKLGEKDQKIIELQSQIIGFLGKTKDVSDLKEKHLLSLQKKDQEIIGLQNRLIEIQENKDKPSNLNPANLTSQNKLKDKKITDLQKQLSAAKQKNSKSLDDMAKTIVDLKNQMAVVMKQEDGKDCNLLQIVHLQKDSLLSTEEVKTESFYLKEESLQNFEESESMNAEFENQHENLNMPPPNVITRRMSTRIIKPYQKRPSSYYY